MSYWKRMFLASLGVGLLQLPVLFEVSAWVATLGLFGAVFVGLSAAASDPK